MPWPKGRGRPPAGKGTDNQNKATKEASEQTGGIPEDVILNKDVTAGGTGGPIPGGPVPRPVFGRSGNEDVWNHENSWIVMTRDRWASTKSGYGGQGRNDCSAIDIVTGRMAWDPDPCTVSDPNFKSDAARIYISQMADVDRYFNLDVNDRLYNLAIGKDNPGHGGVANSHARSCVGIKADAVRLIGREGIKLVTRTEGKNSLKQRIENIPGIELIAGNDAGKLQPITKADDASLCFQEMADLVMDLGASLKKTQETLINFAIAYGSHFHYAGAFPTTPGFSAVPIMAPAGGPLFDATSQSIKIIGDTGGAIIINDIACKNLGFAWRTTFTKPVGSHYIGSRHNKVN